MSDPTETERIRDAQRKALQKERGVEELKAKCRELREILARFGIIEKTKGEYTITFATLIDSLGPEQAKELAQELDAKGISP